ncbi:hypothetical protein BO78DRAFT_364957 [Aspergillus sclerotiicarbonarius CBS 121057]|uniref:Zn(2)-C6 fungal-type domain-containing protein n=1 Tax=Aspergillus sclerotiicarbonarius (strain CBS 121057 / IBT 28362) TaxID=1448318 RepID=A0A319EFR2_ASPSB|nr:hypothetical protein BO78DRAFT_364957 [Aspergillus sclerotiicarbonarius CBS 121057]
MPPGRIFPIATTRRPKSIACQKCHAKKVRCPGGHPCATCVQLNCVPECIYPKRDRQIKISQSYLERLLKENDTLRARSEATGRWVSEPAPVSTTCPGGDDVEEQPTQNPLLDERPWFLPVNSSRIPILIGEVADPAFATRIRQTIARSAPNHIPRTAYPADDAVVDCEVPRLNHAHARFLLRTALGYFEGRYHIVRKSAVWALFEQYIQEPIFLDPLSKCKLSALFSFGELYSSHNKSPREGIPGLAYFKSANRAYGALHERPSADYIEICLILALYSLHINRRHSAYFLASTAVRHCIVMGLHLNIPDFQIQDVEIREHLSRLWWTSYLLDHQCATVSSQIVSVSDDDIFVDYPNTTRILESNREDFPGTDALVSRITLAKLTNRIVKTIYGRRTYTDPFLHRVQSALKDLQQWYKVLPEPLKATTDGSSHGPGILNLTLSFNQCLILATRPVLLYVARTQRTPGGSPGTDHLHSNTHALAEACIRCARDSFSMITETWIQGSFRTFDYFMTQHLFSAATILAIASLLDHSEEDRHRFEFAGQLLGKLRDAGSFPAMEYCQHLAGINADFQTLAVEPRLSPLANVESPPGEEIQHDSIPEPRVDVGLSLLTTPQVAASSAVFADPSMCAFLSQDEFLPAHLDDFLINSQMEAVYWPTLDPGLDSVG